MRYLKIITLSTLALMLSGCDNEGEFNLASAIASGVTVYQAATLEEQDVIQAAQLSAAELDKKNRVAPANSPYSKRLQRIVKGLEVVDGQRMNYRVYLSPAVNAFAMADGTIRVHSGLLDAMPDDQVLAVIGHEIGHVRLQHSYQRMRKQLLTNAVFQAADSAGGDIASLSNSQLGELAYQAINAQFSQADELAADSYAQQILKQLNQDPQAMARSIATLQSKYGRGGGFLSSHPSNPKRLENLQKVIN
ncbi:M48 family metallopeptidase [Aliamphritea spongicola]|uniref:M48 family metallopeptidase n=1 Tax=Aliamphritea spongicola TaxID=707589 RepID=UPI00196B124A|nr:M48 family metallopeptidase [Aliamphritea spongicola]MBN3562195.1 M48 family metallopeptidase [Aliamphritea spongicola]